MPDFIDITVDPNDLKNGAVQLMKVLRPTWEESDIITKVFTDGFSNRLIGCKQSSDTENKDMVLVRVYGANADKLINRAQEITTLRILHAAGCGSEFYCSFNNGMCYKFIPDHCLTAQTMREQKMIALIAQEMLKMQKIDPVKEAKAILGPTATYDPEPIMFKKAWQFMENIIYPFTNEENNRRFQENFGTKERLIAELNEMEKAVKSLDCPIVLSHNDILFNNIVYNKKEDRVYFIDFEYGGCNYFPFDIANHFCEYAGVDGADFSLYPDRDHRMGWIRTYLELKKQGEGGSFSDVTDDAVTKLCDLVEKFTPCPNLFWCLWALAQSSLSDIDFDYMGYAIAKWDQFLKWKPHLIEI